MFFKKYKTEIIIFLLIFFLRILCFIFLSIIDNNLPYSFPLINLDAREYYQLANNLINYHVFSLSQTPPLVPDSFRTPAYPIFLAINLLLFKNFYVILFIQMVMSGLIGVITYKILVLFFKNKKSGLISALLFAFEPSALYYSNMFLTETFFLFCLLISIYYFLKIDVLLNKNIILSGIFLGIAILTRPLALFLPFVLILIFLFLKKIKFKQKMIITLLFFLCIFAVIFPWCIRNKIIFNSYNISSVGSFNLYYFNAMRYFIYKNKVPYEEAKNFFDNQLKPYDINFDVNGDVKLSLKDERIFSKIAMNYIKQNFIGYTIYHIKSMAPFFLTDGLREITQELRITPRIFYNIRDMFYRGKFLDIINIILSGNILSLMLLMGSLTWIILMGFVIYGMAIYLFNKKSSYFIIIIISIIIYFALLSGVVTTVRFRYSIEPFIFILASLGFISMLDTVIKKYKKKNT